MEKFTVDLDKVLDEFEFNEEQAFHQENFKNEDLPAKRYQKPHFQPINMADADFSPSIETTLNFASHNRKYSQDSTNSSIASDSIAFNCKYNDVNHTIISEFGDGHVNNYQTLKDNVNHYNENENFISPNTDVFKAENELDLTDEEKLSGDKENKSNNEFKDAKDDSKDKFENNSIMIDIIPDKNVENGMNKTDESQTKPDLLGSECVVETNSKEEIVKLPDLTDINKENFQEKEINKIENFDLISNDKEAIENFEQEKINEKSSEDESEPHSQLTDEDSEAQESSIEPIQFQRQDDITDEDLHKYLEELEKEEERNVAANQAKPVRPDFLNLNEKIESTKMNLSGAIPLPKDVESKKKTNTEALGSKQENEIRNIKSGKDEISVPESSVNNPKQKEEKESTTGVSKTKSPSGRPLTIDERKLGKVSPFWMPDHFASNCMDCDVKFTVIKRRHHCRACGRILCSKCCGMRASLEYLQNQEQRVCSSCFHTLAKVIMYELQHEEEQEKSPPKKPNPNNPMEYCSTIPPPLQVSNTNLPPPSVLVPVGVLKREGTAKPKESNKQVMFSDGIRPGGDLTDLDGIGERRHVFRLSGGGGGNKRVGTPPGPALLSPIRMLPPNDPSSQSFILEKCLPPVCVVNKGETTYQENWSHEKLIERLKDQTLPPLTFAVNRHLIVSLKIVKLDCCMNKTCWIFCTKGMECVGQDEILILLALKGEEDEVVPRDIFLQLHYIYQEAAKGNRVTELGCWCVLESSFLDSQQHGGFLFIRPTFQCLNHLNVPPPPFLVGILIHRSEIPWARVFPIRLMLRLGAEFRYYPCPLVSVRFRESVYYEIGHTIIQLLADFRNLSYTLPNIRGMKIHMEAKQASILIPRNRYDQVIKALNNSNEPVLALAGNFSKDADAHLVCMQTKGSEITYKTQTININDKPRKVTGASFVVFNGALKSASGFSAKSSFVEDGLLVQVPNETMTVLRNKLRNMEDWSVKCGAVEGDATEEIVKIIWCEDDKNVNIGVRSIIDNMALDEVPSIRPHNFSDCLGSTKFIRWTQVFIIKCEDGATSAKIGDPLEINKLSEGIARAVCVALKKLLDLLAASGLSVLAVRATIDQDNVGYEAGSNGEKLPPIYMNSLDNELIPVLHKAASVNDSVAILELVFHVLDE